MKRARRQPPPNLTAGDVVDLLNRRVERAGSISRAADDLGCSQQLLSAVLLHQRGLSRKILEPLGLRRVVAYELKDGSGPPLR
jgi:hypothetical protein